MSRNKETTHGLSKTREYSIWSKMRLRCYYELNPNYKWYGGKGVYVCHRWKESFTAFLEDVGKAPGKDYTLDRIDSSKNYTCGKCDDCKLKKQKPNCRWATKHDQSRNISSNRYYTHNGKKMILKDWSREAGIPYLTLWSRLDRGIVFSEAISMKKGTRQQKRKTK